MIGELIGLYRRMHNITARQFAERVGISPATVCRIEAGRDCDMGTMLKLIHWLFSDRPQIAQEELIK